MALEHGLELVTGNTTHFQRVEPLGCLAHARQLAAICRTEADRLIMPVVAQEPQQNEGGQPDWNPDPGRLVRPGLRRRRRARPRSSTERVHRPDEPAGVQFPVNFAIRVFLERFTLEWRTPSTRAVCAGLDTDLRSQGFRSGLIHPPWPPLRKGGETTNAPPEHSLAPLRRGSQKGVLLLGPCVRNDSVVGSFTPPGPPSQGGETKNAPPEPSLPPLRRGGQGGFFGSGPRVRHSTVNRSSGSNRPPKTRLSVSALGSSPGFALDRHGDRRYRPDHTSQESPIGSARSVQFFNPRVGAGIVKKSCAIATTEAGMEAGPSAGKVRLGWCAGESGPSRLPRASWTPGLR